MKYKKQIASGAIALSLLVGGSNVFASTPRDLGIKKTEQSFQKHLKVINNIKNKKSNSVVGIVSIINNSNFIIDIKNPKTKMTSSIDVTTNESTIYTKNGLRALASDLNVGQKIIVVGVLDRTANTVIAKHVKLVTIIQSRRSESN